MNLENKIKDYASFMGVTEIGYSNVEGLVPENLKNLKYAISFVIRLSDSIVNEITDKPSFTYFHHYRTINTLIDQITLRTLLILQEYSYNAFAVPASQTVNNLNKTHHGIFQHKTAAARSGIGWIGKSALFISNNYGPRVRLGTVLTDYKPYNIGRPSKNKCANCNLCKDNCPSNAIKGVLWNESLNREDIYDAELCANYMKKNFKNIGRGSVCGICMKVCPYGIIE
jgi:epoxyqueuosine reductase QueG